VEDLVEIANVLTFVDRKAREARFAQRFLICLCIAGKVHGSLARAGKVRGQTPKVAKQDKKKQPKGRAMKRIKFNRRFVNQGEGLFGHVFKLPPLPRLWAVWLFYVVLQLLLDVA
jgi:small subunit ribosomal protein S30e